MFYKDRPRIKVPYSKKHKIIDVLSLLGIVFLIAGPYLYSFFMNDLIPVNFGDYGKSEAFVIPTVIAVWISLTLLRVTPHFYNMPVKITAENAEKQYKIGVDFIYNLKAGIVLLYIFIQATPFILLVQKQYRDIDVSRPIPVLAPLLLLFYFLGEFLYKSIKNK